MLRNAATIERAKMLKRMRGGFEISANDISGGECGDGVQRPMRAFHADAISDRAAQDFSFGVGAGCVHVPAQQTCFAHRIAPEAHEVGAVAFGGGDKAIRMRRFVRDNGGATRLQAGINVALLIGDRFKRTEILNVRRRDCGHQRGMRLHKLRQRQDFAAVVHADLEDRELAFAWHARKRQRHAPMVVVALDGAMRGAAGGQADGKRLLGGRFADGAGDSNALGGVAIARRFAELAQALENIGHGERCAQAFDFASV